MSGSRRTRRVLLPLILVLSVAGGVLAGVKGLRPKAEAAAQTKAWLQGVMGRLPLYFIENAGQADPRVKYYVQGSDASFYFTEGGMTIALMGSAAGRRAEAPSAQVPGLEQADGASERWAMKLDFVASREVAPTGREETPAKISYFKGSPDEWVTGLPTYARVIYPDLWPGIDLHFSGTASRLKYDFIVRPGADPSQIRLAYRGASPIALNPAGQLQVSTPIGGFIDDRPYAYQEVGGVRREVTSSYALGTDGTSYGFSLGAYEGSQPLIVDPAMLVYAGYIGGAGSDSGEDIVVDSAGNAYVTGQTASTEASFPETVGPDLTYNGGGSDAFVAKVNAAGTSLVYAGYIGGAGVDWGQGIAVDSAGNAYVTGPTQSTEVTFPETVGPDLTFNGVEDAFVAKVNAAGTSLVYAGYIGGAATDFGAGIEVDAAGNAYVNGSAQSTEATFPEAVGPDLTYNGGGDAFVAKVNPAGSGLVYAGYIGGSSVEDGVEMALDGAGNAYVAGWTASTQATFPETVGPDLTYNGGGDAFVAKVDAAGTGLVYAGYIGGSSQEIGRGIAVDGAGNAYVAGWTESTEATFPETVGPDFTYNGSTDAFVAKVNPAGTGLVYAGYIGGSGNDTGEGIAVDVAGSAYVTGRTSSSESTFPATGGPDLTYNGGFDAFVGKIDPAGTSLVYAGYIGGAVGDNGFGIAVDAAASAYVTGATASSEATFPETVGPDLTYNGNTDAFVAKISETGPPATLTLDPPADSNTVGTTHCVTATVRDAFGNPVPDVTVRFSVPTATATQASPSTGTDVTDANGEATFCYSASLPGEDAIHAFADTNNDGDQDAGEPFGDATKTWTVPPSTDLCEVTVTEGGWIIANNGDQASFGGNAKVLDDGSVQGSQNYQDHGPAQPRHVKSFELTAVTCSDDLMFATIFGRATIDGSGMFVFRIDVSDQGEPGINDSYGIILSDGYASGQHQLEGGDVQIHKS